MSPTSLGPRRRVREHNTCHDPDDGRFCSDPSAARPADTVSYARLVRALKADRLAKTYPHAAVYWREGAADDQARGWNVLSQHKTRAAATRAFTFFKRVQRGPSRATHFHVVDLRA